MVQEMESAIEEQLESGDPEAKATPLQRCSVSGVPSGAAHPPEDSAAQPAGAGAEAGSSPSVSSCHESLTASTCQTR